MRLFFSGCRGRHPLPKNYNPHRRGDHRSPAFMNDNPFSRGNVLGAPQKQKMAIEETFTAEQKVLKESFEKLIFSYFADDIRVKSRAANEMDEKILSDAVKDDFNKFMSAFVEFIAYNNANLPEDKKSSLAEIFKIIINKN